MVLTDPEPVLCAALQDLHKKHNNRFTPDARQELLQILFRSLVALDESWLQTLLGDIIFQHKKEWSLSIAQGNVDGAEYSEQARGKRCGHIFRSGEATYRCKTCATDDTCVLCSKCFAGTDHTGHQFFISISPGNSGCCDCGDDEAWNTSLSCAIHSELDTPGKTKVQFQPLPKEIQHAVRTTIARAFDFTSDVISCSPEHMKLPKTESSIIQDEINSRLNARWYHDEDDHGDGTSPEFALVLWNDEKHSIQEVTSQVARACKQMAAFGKQKARETDDVGRSIVLFDRDVSKLLTIAAIIEKIKITVTIRSARDIFREEMCGTIIEWLLDICGGKIGDDGDILKNTVCEEMLKAWVPGSSASNAKVGRNGIYDHEIDEILDERAYLSHRTIHDIQIQANGVVAVTLVDGPPAAGQTQTVLQGPISIEQNEDDEQDELMLDVDGTPAADAMELDVLLDEADLPGAGDRELDDAVEADEATLAGYPPPPPPPPPRLQSSGSSTNTAVSRAARATIPGIPKTPHPYTREPRSKKRPAYWVDRFNRLPTTGLPLAEDVRQRVRLDWLVLWDLRLWKKARIDLRSIYIQTLVTVPKFKRILGLRFAGLYPLLAQLYLVADREPDHSIVYLSLQVITTPSVTKEVVEKGNFMTNLFAVLFTFLTTRQVGHPWDVDPAATLAFDTGSVTNRRMYHFFMDIRHLFCAEYIQEMLRRDDRYVLQFLDLIRLGQGICPNVRAVGDHVEYETDAWISASLLTRELNRLCRMFSDAFAWDNGANYDAICRVTKIFARAAILNSMGADRKPLDNTEVTSETRFKQLDSDIYSIEDTETSAGNEKYTIVDFTVETGPVSFHHDLHYMLSWMIECAKSLPAAEIRSLLSFTQSSLAAPKGSLAEFPPERYLMALFDYPLRVCSWLAQMRTQMWVRNGISLRHQMNTYRGVSQRDLAYQRDIFMLQTAMAVCNPGRVLLSMVDRFGMAEWMAGNFHLRPGFEENQMVDVLEDMLHLLLIILTDRTALISSEEDPTPYPVIHRDLIHNLCFKPLSFSDLCNRLADKYQENEVFQVVLEEMTTFKPPDGLTDAGTFTLKPEYLADLDPYISHYSKNQRDEAELIYRKWFSKTTGKPEEDVVVEPKVRPIERGCFKDIGAFTRTDIFAQIIYNSLEFALAAKTCAESIPSTRIETLLQVILHLMLAAIQDDPIDEEERGASFVTNIFHRRSRVGQLQDSPGENVIFLSLHAILVRDDLKACHPKICTVLARIKQKRPQTVAEVSFQMGLSQEHLATDSPMSGATSDVEAKKKAALERQRKVMAQFQQDQQAFMSNHDAIDWGEDDMEEDEPMTTEEQPKTTWKYPSGNCIMCQEETNEYRLYGTFGLLTESRILRQTDLSSDEYLDEVQKLPDNLDKSAEAIRPYGISSKNRVVVMKPTANGAEQEIQRQVLSAGWNPQFIQAGIVSTGCGHVMHWECFNTYCAATITRQGHQIARNHPERIELKEFVCPLCKALGNTFFPIIWKPKVESYPSVATDISLEEFLSNHFPSNLAEHMARADLADEESKVTNIALIGRNVTSFEPVSPIRTPLMGGPEAEQREEGPNPLLDELLMIYDRIRSTIEANALPSKHQDLRNLAEDERPPYTDVLPTALGYSISAIEIAQRGVECEPGTMLLEKISPNVLTHLRILSETASSYIALGALRPVPTSPSILFRPEIRTLRDRQLRQLFWGLRDTRTYVVDTSETVALMEDPFVLFCEVSVCLASALFLDIYHVMQLCYILELVKVVLAVQCSTHAIQYLKRNQHCNQSSLELNDEDLDKFREFVKFVVHNSELSSDKNLWSQPNHLRQFYSFVSGYALTFLRKSAIFLHVRYGVDFRRAQFSLAEEPELTRLTRLLKLPSLVDIYDLFGREKAWPRGTNNDPSQLYCTVDNWLAQWRDQASRYPGNTLQQTSLSHPGIFELIGLPEHYDILLDEMMKRRCPNTGRELVEPHLCLFCGDIFCGQAVCCTVGNRGGCNQHLAKCSGNIGIFLSLKKCCILYLDRGNGTWTNAPYLDIHGESDFGLRRNRQLILNQKRYDALVRKNWLEHSVPSVIARKLEADTNNGGWETL